MKTAKKLILFVIVLTIAGMIILPSCKNRYTGPNRKGIFTEDEFVLPANFLSQEAQYSSEDGPDSQAVVLFTNECLIPALTTTSRGTLIAAVGCGNTAGKLIGKRSSDFGKTWTEFTAFTDSDFSGSYLHPFFINGYDGSILLGIATTNTRKNETAIYKSSDDGRTWTKYGTNLNMTNLIVVTNKDRVLTPDNSFVTYGNGLTLRHGTNKNTLIFPFHYQQKTGSKGHCTATMISRDNGKTWEQFGVDLGDFSSHETKLIELADGNILLYMKLPSNNQVAWFLSTNCGETWTLKTSFNQAAWNDNISHVDFTRYEFNGKDIKNGSGAKYALMAYAPLTGSNSGIIMTTTDFNSGGAGGLSYRNTISTNASSNSYPAITVLPDGTIATLLAETNNIIFRRVNLSWLTQEALYVDYETDNILN